MCVCVCIYICLCVCVTVCVSVCVSGVFLLLSGRSPPKTQTPSGRKSWDCSPSPDRPTSTGLSYIPYHLWPITYHLSPVQSVSRQAHIHRSIIYHLSSTTYPLSSITYYLSSITYQLSPIPCHLSPVPYQLSSITYPLSPVPYTLSPIIYHLSPVTYHLSSITYQLSSITYHLSPLQSVPRQAHRCVTYHLSPTHTGQHQQVSIVCLSIHLGLWSSIMYNLWHEQVVVSSSDCLSQISSVCVCSNKFHPLSRERSLLTNYGTHVPQLCYPLDLHIKLHNKLATNSTTNYTTNYTSLEPKYISPVVNNDQDLR